ncbi:hypothetical protein [Desulfitobacterium sp.]|uniref:hypothetical protein n=1 Tax=Desulfitobacterium sp. TaxID=49981 RepID=UPI002B1FCC70|nr:hypothetical protein [Desulfitobacterium sp.]MEA4900878.1 hypothetical protein [Desulfitobacterium sp.]
MKHRRFVPILALVFLIFFVSNALGATTSSGKMGTVTPNIYQTIIGGECSITDYGNGNINISGDTSTAYAVTQIGVTLHLQYLSGGNWYTLNTYTYTKNNSSYVSGGRSLSVSKGYYYRVAADHTSLYGDINEKGISYSEALYIQ